MRNSVSYWEQELTRQKITLEKKEQRELTKQKVSHNTGKTLFPLEEEFINHILLELRTGR